MGLFRDLTGQRYGRLVVQNFSHFNSHHVAMWVCKCECGKQRIICGTSLTRGRTKSCGCLHDEKAKERATRHNEAHTSLYYVWQAMRMRCFNKNDKGYKNYGGRGITVCAQWNKDYVAFRNWAINNGYKPGLSIDRIDNNKGYCPENCRWATRSQQNNNTRRTLLIEYQGRTDTLSWWCKKLGLNHNTIYARIYCYKWPIEKALTTPIGGHVATL